MSDRILKTVDCHNDQRRRARQEREEAARRTGVACPKCGGELMRVSGGFFVNAVYPTPTTEPAHCGPCGLRIDIER